MHPYLVLLRVGFAVPCGVGPAGGGLLPHRFTLTTHPCGPFGGLFSVALSVGSRRPGVTWHSALWSPDFPRRDCSRRDCLADSVSAEFTRARMNAAVGRPSTRRCPLAGLRVRLARPATFEAVFPAARSKGASLHPERRRIPAPPSGLSPDDPAGAPYSPRAQASKRIRRSRRDQGARVRRRVAHSPHPTLAG